MMFGKTKNENQNPANTLAKPSACDSRSAKEEEDWLVVKTSTDADEEPSPETIAPSAGNIQKTQTTIEYGPQFRMASKEFAEAQREQLQNIISQLKLLTKVDKKNFVDMLTENSSFLKRNWKLIVVMFLMSFLVQEISRSGTHEVPLARDARFDSASNNIPPEHNDAVRHLQAQVLELEAKNAKYSRDLSMLMMERNNWRSRAVGCDQELRELTDTHSKLEESVKNSKLLAPIAFVSPPTPQPMNLTTALHVPKPVPVSMAQPYSGMARPYSAIVALGSTAVTVV